MTKFLQRLQLILWAVAIVLAIACQVFGLGHQLSQDSDMAQYILNMVGVVLLLTAGYFVLTKRNHRLVRIIAVNTTILCTEALYFMMSPKGTTMMYCFLVALLLSLVSYPVREPKKEPEEEENPLPAEPETPETAEPTPNENTTEAHNS